MTSKLDLNFERSVNCRRGFSLIELLAVIVVVSVLVALATAGLSRTLEGGKMAKCVSHQRQVVSALLAYAGENNGRLPQYAAYPERAPYWIDLIAGYLDVPTDHYLGYDYMRCPSAPVNNGATLGVNYAPSPYGIFSYDGNGPGVGGSRSLAKLTPGTMLVADRDPDIGGISIYSPYTSPFNGDGDGDGQSDSSNGILYNAWSPRHGGAAICGFADGSVKRVSIKDWVTNAGGLWGPTDW